MKITFKKLGVIKQAELTLGDLTIVCGRNNTGKTYVTYATYGFLDYWHNAVSISLPNNLVSDVMENGSVTVPVEYFAKDHKKILKSASEDYSKVIDRVFAGNARLFENCSVNVEVEKDEGYRTNEVSVRAGSADRSLLEVKKAESEDTITVSLLVNKDTDDLPPRSFIEDMIGNAVRKIIFKNTVPRPFIASAERTGSAIFQKELDFTRNRLVDLLGEKDLKTSSARLLGRFSADYPVPVRKNIDFIRGLSNIVNRESIFSKQHPEVLTHFQKIIGGEYKVTKDGEVLYIPSNKKSIKLTMVESSSAVRSLLDIGFYLKHIAQTGDLLIVDEPELNLHPENQRLVARLFAMLVNHGIKVFITTHSDYIIKELNTLILLNKQGDGRLSALAVREGYDQGELLASSRLKVYIAKEGLVLLEGNSQRSRCQTLIQAKVDDVSGIALESFDDTIEEMNRIQEEIIWGE